MPGRTKKPVNEAKLLNDCNVLRASVAAFIERAMLGDVKGMLERGVAVTEQLQRCAETVTGTGVST